MAHLLVIGASQGIGLETVKAALAAGHRVRAFARSAGKIGLSDPNLERFPGDALSAPDIAGALDGVEVATGARRLVERLALTLQGSLMVLHSPADLAEAFVESRLGRAKGESFGTLDTGLVTLAGATAVDRATATA